MESIGQECNDLKKKYDECFNVWFSERYLKGDHHSNFCSPLFESYQVCVRDAIKKNKIDLWQIDKVNELKVGGEQKEHKK